MNELSVRITADIQALQSALTKAKKTISDFEKSTDAETNQSNVGFRRKLGLIEALTQKSKQLRTALSQATNEQDIERYNQELEQTIREMTRLNALGRQVGNTLGSTANGFNQTANSIGSANGVAIEFNRIIQDAPFGIIGIGNNLQQLAGNFANVRAQAGSTGKALAASFSSLISPVNLGLLAISALTAGFTAYQMGAFDSFFANEELKKSFKDLADEIDSATANASVELVKINALREVIEDETKARDERLKAAERLQEKYPAIFANADKEKLLNGQLTQSYDILTKSIVQRANASLAEQEIPNLVKQKEIIDSQILSIEKQIETEKSLLDTRSKLTTTQLGSTSEFTVAQKNIEELQKRLRDLDLQQKGIQINIDGYAQAIIDYTQEFEPLLGQPAESVKTIKREFESLPDVVNDALERINIDRFDLFRQGVETPFTISSGRAETQGIIIPDFATKFEEQSDKIKSIVDELSGSFTGLGSLIGRAFDNTGLGQFVGEFLRFSAKLIAANFKIATANAIAGASQSAQATGPAAVFTLPAFIAGAVGLIASAFAAIGGGGGGGSRGASVSASAGAPPQIFTNQNTVTPPGSSGPNSIPDFDFDPSNAQGRLIPMFKWDGFYLEWENYNNRRTSG